MENEKYIGLPTMSLLPLTNVEFSSVKDIEITIPRAGNYAELAPKIFKEEDGEFNLLAEESNTLYLPSITKILLACNKYPTLEPNQLFTLHSLIFDTDSVVIVGSVLTIFKAIK